MLDLIKKIIRNKLYQYFVLGLFISCFWLLLTGMGLAQARRNIRDVIYLKNQQDPKIGEIIKESFEKIEVRISGGRREFLLTNIRNTRYDAEPTKYLTGKREMKNGQPGPAIELLKEALREKQTRDIFKQHIMFYLALCYQQNEQYGEAIQEYDRLLQEVPETRYFRETQLNKVNCYLKGQKTEEAVKAVDKAIDLSYEVEIEREFVFRLRLRKGNILEGLDPKNALVVYKQAEREAAGQPIAARALAGIGRCYIALGEHEQAEPIFKKVIARTQDHTAKGSAYAGLGDCYLKQADTAQSLVSYKKAIMEGYLRTWVLYYPSEDESINDYARSGYSSAYCFEMMSNLLKEEKRRQDYREYARTTYEKVKTKFPETTWAKKAEERLAQLR